MPRSKKYSREQMIDILKSFGKENVSRKDIDENTQMGSMTIIREFGSWKNAIEAAGLKCGVITGRPVSNKISFVDKHSWKCMLGPMAKNIEENDFYAKWEVGDKKHIVFFRMLRKSDISIIKTLIPFNFHYLVNEDIELLKKHFSVEKTRLPSIYLNLDETLNLEGRKNKSIRQKYNRISELGISVENNYRSISDIEEFVKRWSGVDGLYADKYFRNMSGKNLFYFRNNFHKDCISVFLYDKKLLGFGVLSPPNRNGFSTYIVGKALYADINIGGLSEFLDLTLYKKGYDNGVKYVNLGASFSKQLFEYKRKFSGKNEFIEFEGKVLKGE